MSAPLRSDADRADEALIERLRRSLEQLDDAHLGDPVIRRRCFIAIRALPAEIARLGEAALACERIRRAAFRPRVPQPEIGGGRMSLFPTMPLPAVSAWIDHFLRLAVGDCAALRAENLDLRADRAAIEDELAKAAQKIAALETHLAFERDLNRREDEDATALRAKLARAQARARALEAAAGARLNAWCRLEDAALRLRRENAELRAALTSEAAQ